MDYEIWVWGGLVVATLITEFVTDELVAIWFSAGAVVALLFAIFGLPIWSQIVVFVATSAILLLSTRKFVKKVTNRPTEKTNVDALVGKETKLLDAITEDDNGAVKFDGVIWTAVSKDGKAIDKGEKVVVLKIVGNKLIVAKQEQKENK